MSLLTAGSELAASTEFWSAIVGSLVGGGIGLTVQVIGLREARRQRRLDRLAKDRALAGALLFKLVRMYSAVSKIHDHVEGGIARAHANGEAENYWAHVLAVANPPVDVHLDPEEMGMLFSQGDMTVSNRVLALDSRHNALVEALRVYGEKRGELRRRLPATKSADTTLSITLSPQDYTAFLPLKIELDSLVSRIRRSAADEVVAFHAATKDTQALLTRTLGLPFGFDVPVPPGSTGQSRGPRPAGPKSGRRACDQREIAEPRT